MQGPICKKNIGGGRQLEAPQAPSNERRRREERGAEGCGVWGGGVPLPTEGGVWGGGCAPSPEKFLIFHLKIVSFSAFWGVFYHSSATLFTAKISVFWLTEHFSIY